MGKQGHSQEDDFPIHYLGKADLIRAKVTAGRLQDLADIEEIRRSDEANGEV